MNLIRPTYIPPATSSTTATPELNSPPLTQTSLSNKTKTKTSNSLSSNERTNIALNPAYKIDCSQFRVKLENRLETRLENTQTVEKDINKEDIYKEEINKEDIYKEEISDNENGLISSTIITNILEYIDSYLPPVKYVYTDGLNRNKINKERYWKDIVNLFGLEHKEELPNTADAVFGASIQNLHNGKIKPVLFQASKAKIAFIKSASKASVGGTSYSAEIIPREVCLAFFCGVYVDLDYLNSLEYQECLQSLSWLTNKSEISKSETNKLEISRVNTNNKNIKDLTEEEIKTIIAICYEFYRFKIN